MRVLENIAAAVVAASLFFAGVATAQTVQLPRAYIYGEGKRAQAPYYAIMQGNLKILDYYSGAIDGQVGPGTVAAIKDFQRDKSLPASGSLNAATTRAAKRAVSRYYRAQLGFDFNGIWALKGKCSSFKDRFQIHQSAWFKPTGSRAKLPTLDFARVKSRLVEPRLSETWPNLKTDGKRPFIEEDRPPLPLTKPEEPRKLLDLTFQELQLIEDNWPDVDLNARASTKNKKPSGLRARARKPGGKDRKFLQRCS